MSIGPVPVHHNGVQEAARQLDPFESRNVNSQVARVYTGYNEYAWDPMEALEAAGIQDDLAPVEERVLIIFKKIQIQED